MNDSESELIEIEDLAAQAEEVQNAEQVRGGFDPQPDPPKAFIPPFRPPVIINPGIIR
jgi:hypothetical protein